MFYFALANRQNHKDMLLFSNLRNLEFPGFAFCAFVDDSVRFGTFRDGGIYYGFSPFFTALAFVFGIAVRLEK